MIKYCFIDVETTGLDPSINGIVQIAGQIVYSDRGQYAVIESFNFKVQPFQNDFINNKALEVNKLTRDQINKFDLPEVVFKKFVSVLDRHADRFFPADSLVFVAFKADFDNGFIREFFKKNKKNIYNLFFYKNHFDVLQLALFTNRHLLTVLPNFKLTTLCDHFNINPEGSFHDASIDIDATRKLFELLIRPLDKE